MRLPQREEADVIGKQFAKVNINFTHKIKSYCKKIQIKINKTTIVIKIKPYCYDTALSLSSIVLSAC